MLLTFIHGVILELSQSITEYSEIGKDFVRGIWLGLGLAILFIGPSFFALIQCSIKNGFRSAAVMACGISLSDVFLVALVYLGISQLLDNPRNIFYMRAVAIAILFGFGIYTLFQKHSDEKDAQKGLAAVPTGQYPVMFVKGFFLNLFNPSVLFFWITCVGATRSKYSTNKEALAFFIGALGTVFATDILKSLVANRIKKLLTHKLMKGIHYLMGIALIICGIVLLIELLHGSGLKAA
jgi:threonine/homoserine/homoserine lactone efflux protein